ncbi:hypothetical protein FWK35_00017765 [Aphis craccivora]|uniref:Uncharacterized protein n=1 Tax=Aphis craccivora TaxID=307492 RepID=A0A6G0YFD8_APHCR|nr:hypothetical protein FWK35_00017765 [Aphis craccivora]
MTRCFGANLSFSKLITFFQHPELKKKFIYYLMQHICSNYAGILWVIGKKYMTEMTKPYNGNTFKSL